MPIERERRGSNKVFLAVATAALTGTLAWLVSTAWSTKADKADLAAHVSADAVLYVRDSLWKEEQRDMTLELLCRTYPSSRRCR